MSRNDDTLGVCPECGTTIRPTSILVSYERSDDSTGIFAECPSCGTVVTPE